VDPEEPPKSISDYLSDSIGDADPLGAGGVFSDFAKEYGFSMHELTGKYLSEGF
jgi:hypothetical protein